MRALLPLLLLTACAGDATGRHWVSGVQIDGCQKYCVEVDFWTQEQLDEPADIVRDGEPVLPVDGGIGVCACKPRTP